jgi:flagellar hook assembly protein FlgD
VLDAAGRVVRRVHQGKAGPGSVTFLWDGRDDASHPVGSGVYFIRVEAEGQGRATAKVIRLK